MLDFGKPLVILYVLYNKILKHTLKSVFYTHFKALKSGENWCDLWVKYRLLKSFEV